jgi:hypothetical protein
LLANCRRVEFIQVQNANRGTIRRESQGDGSSNATAATGYDGNFSVQSETLRMGILICQSETPRFQGENSSCNSLRNISGITFAFVLAIAKCVLRFAAQLLLSHP